METRLIVLAGLLVAGCTSEPATDAAPAPDTSPGDLTALPADEGAPAAPDVAVLPDAGPPRPAGGCFFSGGVLNIAHRGGRDLAPEHTLVAYETGLAAGADVLELDIHGTSDGALVAIHDDTADRTTDGAGEVSKMTLAELRALDAGFRFTKDGGGTFPFRGQGLRIPTLGEILDGFEGTCVTVEIKQHTPSIVAEVLDAFATRDAIELAVFSSFDDTTLAAIRALRPDALTGLGIGEMVTFALMEQSELATYVPPALVAQPPKDQINAALVERAHAFSMLVHVWTVNDPADMASMLALGVDGIITDDPATLDTLLHPK